MHVSISVNGEQVSREIEPRLLLVHFIRETPGLTGTHWGCDTSMVRPPGAWHAPRSGAARVG